LAFFLKYQPSNKKRTRQILAKKRNKDFFKKIEVFDEANFGNLDEQQFLGNLDETQFRCIVVVFSADLNQML